MSQVIRIVRVMNKMTFRDRPPNDHVQNRARKSNDDARQAAQVPRCRSDACGHPGSELSDQSMPGGKGDEDVDDDREAARDRAHIERDKPASLRIASKEDDGNHHRRYAEAHRKPKQDRGGKREARPKNVPPFCARRSCPRDAAQSQYERPSTRNIRRSSLSVHQENAADD